VRLGDDPLSRRPTPPPAEGMRLAARSVQRRVGLERATALTIRSGQTHVQRYMKPLLARIEQGELDPSFVITHRLPLDEAPAGYAMFLDKQDECVKVVLSP
jgi:threonine dehydrogenase-like Zn-dependent dehydrogenase